MSLIIVVVLMFVQRWNAERVNKFFTWKSYSRIYNDDAPKPQFAYALNDLESILFSKGKDYEEDEEVLDIIVSL
jgi:hypothetical protein